MRTTKEIKNLIIAIKECYDYLPKIGGLGENHEESRLKSLELIDLYNKDSINFNKAFFYTWFEKESNFTCEAAKDFCWKVGEYLLFEIDFDELSDEL